MKDYIDNLCIKAKNASFYLQNMSNADKNQILITVANTLDLCSEEILAANKKDVEQAKICGMPAHFIDRLTLNYERLMGMKKGVLDVVSLPDPCGKILEQSVIAQGMKMTKISVPLGVLCIIYEARPNVTTDAAALAIKSGNVCILRGSKDAINSNTAIINAVKANLIKNGFNADIISLCEDTSHDAADYLMTKREYIDVIIPRGGANLIKSVVENSKIPVIETGTGNCHIYVEKSADFNEAIKVILNAKISRPSVCNAAESLIVDRCIAKGFLKEAVNALKEKNVEVRVSEEIKGLDIDAVLASDSDFYTEYNDYVISVALVDGVKDAVTWVNAHSTHHSEAIMTTDKKAAEEFVKGIDSACVYVNASTRFTDGGEFGIGAEIGISTQKLHARGPVGLTELCSYKYIISGNNNVR